MRHADSCRRRGDTLTASEDYIQTLGVNFMEKAITIRNTEITFSVSRASAVAVAHRTAEGWRSCSPCGPSD